ncbi:MAG: hypothetical protein ACJA04_000065 [Cellvibrionaceae bacterium]|jgi:hypothetical protein
MLINTFFHRALALIILLFVTLAVQATEQQTPRQNLIDDLLAQADYDLAYDRLTTPIERNAYDRYRAVLLLDKSNRRAVLGVRAIADRYLTMADEQKNRGNFTRARYFLGRATKISGPRAEITELRNLIAAAETVARQARLNKPPSPPTRAETVFTLNPLNLQVKSPNIVSTLEALGQRVQRTREYILIYARNDAEGRWIYQQIRKASRAYRPRANIKRHTKPRVVLQDPLS